MRPRGSNRHPHDRARVSGGPGLRQAGLRTLRRVAVTWREAISIVVAAAWVTLFSFMRHLAQLCSHARERRWPVRIGPRQFGAFPRGPI